MNFCKCKCPVHTFESSPVASVRMLAAQSRNRFVRLVSCFGVEESSAVILCSYICLITTTQTLLATYPQCNKILMWRGRGESCWARGHHLNSVYTGITSAGIAAEYQVCYIVPVGIFPFSGVSHKVL